MATTRRAEAMKENRAGLSPLQEKRLRKKALQQHRWMS